MNRRRRAKAKRIRRYGGVRGWMLRIKTLALRVLIDENMRDPKSPRWDPRGGWY